MPSGNNGDDEFSQYKVKPPEDDEWAQYKAKPAAAATPERPGFFKRLGQSVGLPTSAEELKQAGQPSTAETILGPIVPAAKGAFEWGKRTIQNIGEGGEEEIEAARNIGEGGPIGANLGKAAGGIVHGGIGSIPFIGEPMETAAQDVLGKNYPGAAGGLTGVVGQVAAPELARRIGEHISPAATEARSLAKSTKEIKEAAPPGRHEIDYNAQLERARPYLAEEQRRTPVKSVREAHEVANDAVSNIEQKTREYARTFPDEQVSGQEVLDRVEQKLRDPNSPRTEAEIQAGLKAVQDFLSEEVAGEPTEEGEAGEPTRVPKDLSLEQIDRLRWRMNQDTEAEMGMTESDRGAVRASNPKFAAKEEAANALRDIFYGRLEQRGVPNVRGLRLDEGGILQMRDAFRRNITRAEKSNAPSAMRRIGVFGPIGLGFLGETLASHVGAPPGVSAGLGIGTAAAYEFMRNRMRPNPLMERGFRRVGKSSLKPNFPEVRPQPPAEAIGTPIEPTTPNEPPTGGRGGVNEPLPTQPEGGRGIGEPIEQRRRTGVSPTGAERRVGTLPLKGITGPDPVRAALVGNLRELAADPELKPETKQVIEDRIADIEGHPFESGAGLGEEIRQARAAKPAEPILPAEEEPVETKVKGITAEEPKTKAKRETLPSVEKLYDRDEITDAEGLIQQEIGMLQSADRPGRYYDENEIGEYNNQAQQSASKGITSGGNWRGVRSGREMQPFLREHPDWSPAALEKALRNKDSALYKKAIGAAVEFIRRESEAERAAIQEEGKASIAGEPIFPGMGRAVAEQAQGAAQVRGEELTRRMNEPKSIESAAGEMETKSPLFRGTAASPQNEMFGAPIEPEVLPRPSMNEFLRSGGQGERPILQGPRGTIERLKFHRQNIVNLEERLQEETEAGQREDAEQTRRELKDEREFMRRAMQGVQTQP